MSATIQYVIIEFPESRFTGEIAPELALLVEKGLIQIVDLVCVTRTEEGDLLAIEVDEDADLTVFAALEGEVGGVIGPEDIEYAGEGLEPGATVLMILWVNLWSGPLADAMLRAGGKLVEGGMIPADLQETVEALASAG